MNKLKPVAPDQLPRTLASYGQLDYTLTKDVICAKLQINISEHRYLLSHLINEKVVIPSVFMLELAHGVLAKTNSKLAERLLSQPQLQWRQISATRLAYLTGGEQQTLYFDWQPCQQQGDYQLTVSYDKLNQQGQCVRPKLTVLTATLVGDAKNTTPNLVNAMPSGELIERALIDDFKAQSPATLGILFNNLTFKYLRCPKTQALWCYSDLRNSRQYCLQTEIEPDFITPVLAAMSAVQHLPFYGYLDKAIALPSHIGGLTFYGDRQNSLNHQGKLVCQIAPAKTSPLTNQGLCVDVLVCREADLTPILQFEHYHLQPQLH
ncbi:hypothetical protein [Motilimonas eburnea]|uniref:hypothetical protein n=1 Tax=Motilimonas eburnea TaxID=1737488 RepID=UPI001E45327A|nr:hypothetical protein [Motilimonas eburnea]MCE2570358.1 hypothetical protein [Motilimonas eburnea]